MPRTCAPFLCIIAIAAACNDSGGSGSVAPPPGPVTPATMAVSGLGAVAERYTAEVWAAGHYAYTTTWGRRGNAQTPGNAIYIWDLAGNVPTLVDSVVETSDDITTLGDVQLSDDGTLLVVPTERAPGSIIVFDLTNPRRPVPRSRFFSQDIDAGVHTCTIARVDGVLYAFLAVNASTARPARLVIVDLADPAQPTQVLVGEMGRPIVHDMFVRDGLLFAALWNDGLNVFDVGGGGAGGSVRNPVLLGSVVTVGGNVHNVWWVHDPVTQSKRFAIVGEEGPGVVGATSSGDIHVVDLADIAHPKEVAFLHVDDAGTHNFSVDETRGILYAAYYNAGVQAIDVRGDLSACPDSARVGDRCSLKLAGRLLGQGLLDQGTAVYVWGVHYLNGRVYATDMLNGIWALTALTR